MPQGGYENNIPEKIIQERTGHRSLESLRCYERTSNLQHNTVSNILSTLSTNPQQPSTIKATHYSSTSNMGVHQQCSMYTTPAGFSFKHLNGCTINICQLRCSTCPLVPLLVIQLSTLNTVTPMEHVTTHRSSTASSDSHLVLYMYVP